MCLCVAYPFFQICFIIVSYTCGWSVSVLPTREPVNNLFLDRIYGLTAVSRGKFTFFCCEWGEWLGRPNGTRSCRFSWLKIILMALWNWTPSVAAGRKNEQRRNRPPRLSRARNDRAKITGCAFWQNNSTIWLPSRIFINFPLFDAAFYNENFP